MERSLHQQIKRLVARDDASVEVRFGNYRIDAIDSAGQFVEVQCAPLAAIRDKITIIRENQRIRIIKPIVTTKTIEVLDAIDGRTLRRRRSPKRLSRADICLELLHFTRCFPHPHVALEFWLVDVHEIRVDRPKAGRQKPYRTIDVQLSAISERILVNTPRDLIALLPVLSTYREPFCTKRLSLDTGMQRWQSQQTAFVLERTGAIRCVGKRGNSRLFEVAAATALTPKRHRRTA